MRIVTMSLGRIATGSRIDWCAPDSLRRGAHMLGVALRGMIAIVPFPNEWVLGTPHQACRASYRKSRRERLHF